MYIKGEKMKISFGIMVHNEGTYLENLLGIILENCGAYFDYEIIIIDDFSDDKLTVQTLKDVQDYDPQSTFIYQRHLNNNFAAQKNFLNSKCTGDYIFQIDADETPSEYILTNLVTILESNDVDLYWIPRINTVEGLTQEHIQQWRWRVTEQGWVNWPDFQSRIYKNTSEIKWKFAVHEIIVGHKSFAYLPDMEQCALTHHKTISRQKFQNQMYSKIERK